MRVPGASRICREVTKVQAISSFSSIHVWQYSGCKARMKMDWKKQWKHFKIDHDFANQRDFSGHYDKFYAADAKSILSTMTEPKAAFAENNLVPHKHPFFKHGSRWPFFWTAWMSEPLKLEKKWPN